MHYREFKRLACSPALIKRLCFLITAMGFLLLPSTATAAYMIELSNGAKFITYQYWKENGQVRFFYAGGILGFEERIIKRIEASDAPYEEQIISDAKPQSATDGAGAETAGKKVKKPDGAKENERDGEGKEKKQEDIILKDFSLLEQRFKNVDRSEKEGLYQLVKDLTQFRNKVLTGGLGSLYSDQLLNVAFMLDDIETALKTLGS